MIISLIMTGCADSDNPVNTPGSFDARSLMGLVDGRTLYYIQTEIEVTIEPFSITKTDTVIEVSVGGADDDWIFYRSNQPLINLKISENSIIQNGYWRTFNGIDSLVYYTTPPLILERTVQQNSSWIYYTPYYQSEGGQSLLPYYFANFGFKVSKTYVGNETVITPAGEFDTYRYDLVLSTSEFGENAVAEISEYYAPNIGLVKQVLVNGSDSRSLILFDYTD